MKRFAERKLAWGFGLALTVLAGNALISYRDLADLVRQHRATSILAADPRGGSRTSPRP